MEMQINSNSNRTPESRAGFDFSKKTRQQRPNLTLIQGYKETISQAEAKLPKELKQFVEAAKNLPADQIVVTSVNEENMPKIPGNKSNLTPSDLMGQPLIKLNGGFTLTTVPTARDNGGIGNIIDKKSGKVEAIRIESSQYSKLMNEIQATGKLNNQTEARKPAVAA